MTTNTLPQECCTNEVADNARVRSVRPPVDIYETNEAFVLQANTAGLSDKDLNIQIEDNTLRIAGTAPVQESHGAIHRLYDEIQYERSFQLGRGVNQEAVQAELKQGTLTITLAKVEQAQPQHIEVRSNT